MAYRDSAQSQDIDHELRPHDRAGEQAGNRPTRAAHDLKAVHGAFHDLPDNLLEQTPILQPGTRLEEGGTYIDLRHPERGEFKGMNNITAGPDDWYVPKSHTDYELWNLLLERVGIADRVPVRDPAIVRDAPAGQ